MLKIYAFSIANIGPIFGTMKADMSKFYVNTDLRILTLY